MFQMNMSFLFSPHRKYILYISRHLFICDAFLFTRNASSMIFLSIAFFRLISLCLPTWSRQVHMATLTTQNAFGAVKLDLQDRSLHVTGPEPPRERCSQIHPGGPSQRRRFTTQCLMFSRKQDQNPTSIS